MSPLLAAETEADRVARQSYGKLVAFLASRHGDVAAAEEALAEAFATALQQWRQSGVPSNPEAWLLTVARRKMIDLARQQRRGSLAEPHLKLMADELAAAEADTASIPDRRLALMFACAHPAIEQPIRTPLILQTVLGFDAATIASAFLTSPTTMGQRLVRAKAKIKSAGIPFAIPEAEGLAERLDDVLDAIYACYADGWADATDSEATRREHAREAIWLGQLVASLLPTEAEAFSLLALMLYAESRRAARRDAVGRYRPLSQQDPALWDRAMIEQADALVREAGRSDRLGRFQLQAAIQAVHAARLWSGRTDWAAIEQLYEVLYSIAGSAVVAINRAVAVAEVRGAHQGLAALNAIGVDKQVADYQPYWAARARLLASSGDLDAADQAYEIAAGLASDPTVRDFLQTQRRTLRR